jgi:predicted nucleic acid-binding protein
MIKKILFDTNILIYLSLENSPVKIKNAKSLITKNKIFISDRSLLEFYRVYTGKLKQSVETTLEIVNYYQNHPNYNILTSTDSSNQLTFEFAGENQAKSGKIFDLNILAIAIENEIDILYTKNIKDFPETKQIEITDPTV